jgi:hypothetical protein
LAKNLVKSISSADFAPPDRDCGPLAMASSFPLA